MNPNPPHFSDQQFGAAVGQLVHQYTSPKWSWWNPFGSNYPLNDRECRRRMDRRRMLFYVVILGLWTTFTWSFTFLSHDERRRIPRRRKEIRWSLSSLSSDPEEAFSSRREYRLMTWNLLAPGSSFLFAYRIVTIIFYTYKSLLFSESFSWLG